MIGKDWAAEARGDRWGSLQELARSFVAHAAEFGAEFDDALACVYTIARGWGFSRAEVSIALERAHREHAVVCGRMRRARLLRVVPALRRAAAANDRSRSWAEAA